MNIFEIATRNKYRFEYKGVATVEDLWDLSVTALDKVYKSLKAKMKENEEESLLAIKTAADEELATKIDIVKYIVSVKLAEADKKKVDMINNQKRQRIAEIIASKEDKALQDMSIEELQAMMNSL